MATALRWQQARLPCAGGCIATHFSIAGLGEHVRNADGHVTVPQEGVSRRRAAESAASP